MNIYCRFFYTVKILKINVILNYFWLHVVNSGINWKKQTWQYLINFKQISIVSSEEFALKMKEVKQVFVIMLSFFMKTDQSAQIMLSRELTDFQNVIVTGEELMPFLHESVMHHINTENQKILYRSLYNLFLYELKILCEYLDDALVKGWIQYSINSVEFSVLFILKRDESL